MEFTLPVYVLTTWSNIAPKSNIELSLKISLYGYNKFIFNIFRNGKNTLVRRPHIHDYL